MGMMPGCSRRPRAGGTMEQSYSLTPSEQPNMQPTVPLFVGLDYSQHKVQVCALDPQGKVLGNRAVPDSGAAQGAALEACTGAADLAEELADRFGWPMHLGHPGFVSRMKQSPDKSDFSDARVLADLERVGYLPRVWIAPKHLRELRTLVRDRQQLVAQRRNLKLAITALLREHRQRCQHTRWTVAWRAWVAQQAQLPEQARWVMTQRLRRLEWVVAEVHAVERRLEEVTKDDGTVRRLRAIKGL